MSLGSKPSSSSSCDPSTHYGNQARCLLIPSKQKGSNAARQRAGTKGSVVDAALWGCRAVLCPTSHQQPTPALTSQRHSSEDNVDGEQMAPSPTSKPPLKRSISQLWHPAPVLLLLLLGVRKKSKPSLNHSQPGQDAVHKCSFPPLRWEPSYFSTRCRRLRSLPLTVTNDLTRLGPVIFRSV